MKFHSKRLQSCFDSTKPVLDKMHEIKDYISADIILLEKYLKSLNFNEPFKYLITDPWNPANVVCELDPSGMGEGKAIEEYLIWDNKKNRIMFIRNEYSASIEMPVYINSKSTKPIFDRPLIETPFEIRKRMFENSHIENFLLEIGKKYDFMNELANKTLTT